MTDKQPEALEYADKLEKVFGMTDYANEMRRLHEENQRWEEAVAAEREACANLLLSADLSGLRNDLMLQNWTANLLANFAAAIRARGQS